MAVDEAGRAFLGTAAGEGLAPPSGGVLSNTTSSPRPSPVPPPSLTGARLSHARFRVAKAATALAAATPLGTSFLFTLSAGARVQIAIVHAVTGLRRGKLCVAPTRALGRGHAHRCTRTVALGTLTRAHELAGADRVAFSGRLGRRPLAPGAYRAILTATNGSGSSRAVALAFTVLR